MAGISSEERRKRAVVEARKMLMEYAPRTMELLIAAIERDGDEGFADIPAANRSQLLMKALEYQQGKPTPHSKVKEDDDAEVPKEEPQGLQIA
jgi:hypothetical protein